MTKEKEKGRGRPEVARLHLLNETWRCGQVLHAGLINIGGNTAYPVSAFFDFRLSSTTFKMSSLTCSTSLAIEEEAHVSRKIAEYQGAGKHRPYVVPVTAVLWLMSGLELTSTSQT